MDIAMEKQKIEIPPIELEWSDWVLWTDLKLDARKSGIKVPNGQPCVYEARHQNAEERLTIRKASNLREQIKQGLVKGKLPNSAGEKIRANEDTSTIFVRWAVTDRPAAVKEELHIKYKNKFGKLPKYVEHL
jgi:hypothetical protein